MSSVRLPEGFFRRDVLEAAPELVGKILVHRLENGDILRERIAETEAYRGEEDKGCYASHGRTSGNELLYGGSGIVFMRLCYGMHWLMNIITGEVGQPQGILIRAGELHRGPAKLTKFMQIDGSFGGADIMNDDRLWIEDDGVRPGIVTAPRVGIDYAGEYWKDVEWRFILRTIAKYPL